MFQSPVGLASSSLSALVPVLIVVDMSDTCFIVCVVRAALACTFNDGDGQLVQKGINGDVALELSRPSENPNNNWEIRVHCSNFFPAGAMCKLNISRGTLHDAF